VVLAVLAALVLLGMGFGIGRGAGDGDEAAPGTGSDGTGASLVAGAQDRPAEAPLEGDDDEPVAAVAGAIAPAVVQVETPQGLGSGIVYDADGLILTNAHVVGDADEVLVILGDGRQFTGEVLGADQARDVAVVRVDPGDVELQPAVLAVSDDVQVGQMAVAVGSPFGFDQTVTAGIVSAVGRPLPGPNGELIVGMIQTDAPINSGNSGGALADRRGRVIGINTSIRSRSGDNTGIGFAIPISLAVRVGDSIVEGDVPGPSFLGVRGPELSDGNGLDEGQAGAIITEVTSGSSADGVLEVGDVIVEISGHPVRDFEALAGFIGSFLPGDEVDLTVLRDGDRIELTIELGERSEALVG
jgi:serine protease Do